MINKQLQSNIQANGTVTVAKISKDTDNEPVINIQKTKNVTVTDGHNAILRGLQQNTERITVSQIAVGTGGQNGTSSSDSSLNNRVGLGSIFNSSIVGNDGRFSGLIGVNLDPNDKIDEVGLRTNNGTLINHATISPIPKDSNSIILITVELTITN